MKGARFVHDTLERPEDYEAPPLDDAIEQELGEYVERRAAELGDPLSLR